VVSEIFPVSGAVQPAAFAAGSRVAGYRLEEQIGSGGMAVVFRARDERLQRQVAVKILAPALAADEEFRHRFILESRAAAAVDDPHIIPVFEAGEAGGVLFIAMRYVPGGDVRTLLRRAGPLPPERAMAIISPVASALDAAHGAGLVHRDVKPANMLVDVGPGRPDHVYLSDFGLSKGVTSSGRTMSGQFLGTPDYSAPEHIAGQPVDGRADQYSLACAAFELLCGEAPFPREHVTAVMWAHMSEPAPMLTSRRPGLPPGVDGVLAKALTKAPEGRYVSCREFADALREALDLAFYHSGFGNRALASQDFLSTPPDPDSAFRDAPTQARPRLGWPPAHDQDRGAAAADPESAVQETDGRKRRIGARPVALSLAAALAVVGIVVGLSLTRVPPSPPRATKPPPTASYAFPAQRYRNGLLIARRWTLGGRQGSQLTETITLSNPTGKSIAAWFKDSIPTAITNNVQTVHLSPGAKVVQADPVVEWYLRIPAHHTVTVGYVAHVPPKGTATARLAVWAKGLNTLEKRLNTPPAKHPRPVVATQPPVYQPTSEPTPDNGFPTTPPNGGPNPYPTYSCDPSVVTCNPNAPSGASSSPSPSSSGGLSPGF
jgi:serine/threonine protein kinase